MAGGHFARNTAVATGVAALAVVPVAGSHFQQLHEVWPPVGGSVIYVAPAAAIVGGAFGMAAAYFRTTNAGKQQFGVYLMLVMFVLLLSLVAYTYLVTSYVGEVETLHEGIQYRTVGDRLTQRGKEVYSGWSNSAILKDAGFTQDKIEKVWTPESVKKVRLELISSYLLLLLSSSVATGSFGKFDSKK